MSQDFPLLADGSNLDGWNLRTSIDRGYLPGHFSREEHRSAGDHPGS